MKKKVKIILIILLFAVLGIAGYFYFDKDYNIKKYFKIQIPSNCEFVSYKKTRGVLKAVVKANELDMTKILENVKNHATKVETKESEEACYFILEEDFEIEKERVTEMYDAFFSLKKMFTTIKSSQRYVFL